MLDTLTAVSSAAIAPAPPLTTRADKREAIDRELQADPRRTDREIARTIGVDHKTVAARRREISPHNSPRPPTPTERRHMMIEGVKDFDAHFPQPTPEEAVDSAIAKGATLATDPDRFDWSSEGEDADSIVIPEQLATAVYTNKAGEIVIRQKRWPDDDVYIFLTPDAAPRFLEKFTEIMGIPTVGR